jgi:hypothetical protein
MGTDTSICAESPFMYANAQTWAAGRISLGFALANRLALLRKSTDRYPNEKLPRDWPRTDPNITQLEGVRSARRRTTPATRDCQEIVFMTTVEALRTPDDRFGALPDFPYPRRCLVLAIR